MSDKAKFAVGDVVALRSGGQLMTVTRIQDGKIICHHRPELETWYPPEAIEHASDARVHVAHRMLSALKDAREHVAGPLAERIDAIIALAEG